MKSDTSKDPSSDSATDRVKDVVEAGTGILVAEDLQDTRFLDFLRRGSHVRRGDTGGAMLPDNNDLTPANKPPMMFETRQKLEN